MSFRLFRPATFSPTAHEKSQKDKEEEEESSSLAEKQTLFSSIKLLLIKGWIEDVHKSTSLNILLSLETVVKMYNPVLHSVIKNSL